MRKYVTLTALLVAVAWTAVPLSPSYAGFERCEGWYCKHHHHKMHKPQKPATQSQSHNSAGQVAVGCGIASAASLMIGTAIKAGDKDKKHRRQLTINEAAWYASACPVFLPWALLVQATCPDNKATYTVATLAYQYLDKHPASDQSAFTRAYGEACRTGKLSPATQAELGALVGFAAAKPVLRVRG